MFRPNPVEVITKYFKELNRIYLDIETSGLEPYQGAAIFSIAMIYEQFYWDKPPDATEEFEIVFKFSEADWKRASPEALKVNGITWEFLQEHGVPFKEGVHKLVSWLGKFKLNRDEVFVVGQNPQFDLKFLKAYMGPYLEFVGFPFRKPLDNIELAKTVQKFDKTLKLTRYNSHALSKALGVEEESKVHTAIGGARAVYRNFYALHKRMAEVEKRFRKIAMGKLDGDDAILIPFEGARTIDTFIPISKQNGWKQAPWNPNVFIDSNGQRWSYWQGTPPILVKL